MLKRMVLFFLVFCSLTLAGQISAEDRKRYPIIVPTNFKTIKEAVENAKPGDTILVKEGVYEEKEGFGLKNGLKIEGKGADKTIIKVGPRGITKAPYWVESDYIKEKLITKTISNEPPRPGGAKEPERFILKLSPQGRAKAAAGKDNLDNVAIKGLSMELSGESLRVSGATGFLLQDCLITSKSILACIQVDASKNVQILNCTIVNSAVGVSVLWGPVDLTVRNSIFYNNKTAIRIWETPIASDTTGWPKEKIEELRRQPREDVKVTLTYNDFWDNAANCYKCKKGEFDISKDPEFIDPEKLDFHIGGRSPCINAGDPDQKYNDPDGSRNDIGAFPFAGKK